MDGLTLPRTWKALTGAMPIWVVACSVVYLVYGSGRLYTKEPLWIVACKSVREARWCGRWSFGGVRDSNMQQTRGSMEAPQGRDYLFRHINWGLKIPLGIPRYLGWVGLHSIVFSLIAHHWWERKTTITVASSFRICTCRCVGWTAWGRPSPVYNPSLVKMRATLLLFIMSTC